MSVNKVKKQIAEAKKAEKNLTPDNIAITREELILRRKALKDELNRTLDAMRKSQLEYQELDKKAFACQKQIEILNELISGKGKKEPKPREKKEAEKKQ